MGISAKCRVIAGSAIASSRSTRGILELYFKAILFMFGTFQQSSLRLEVAADEATLRESLTRPVQMQKWLIFQRFSLGLPDLLAPGVVYTSWTGPIAIQHQVEIATPNHLRLLLHQGIDGFHEWAWGEGWVQSRIEGISLLPINLGQTASLLCLKQYLASLRHPEPSH